MKENQNKSSQKLLAQPMDSSRTQSAQVRNVCFRGKKKKNEVLYLSVHVNWIQTKCQKLTDLIKLPHFPSYRRFHPRVSLLD